MRFLRGNSDIDGNNMTSQNPPCIVSLGDDRYRCKNTGNVYKTKTLPIHCPCKEPNFSSLPPICKQAWNLTKSLADFASDGFKLVTKEEYAARLVICDSCEYRRNTRCSKCGCNLAIKAKGRAFKCPENKWPNVQIPQLRKPSKSSIVFMTHALAGGGAERWVVDLATRLDKNKWNPSIYIRSTVNADAGLLKLAKKVTLVQDIPEETDIAIAWAITDIPPAHHKVYCIHGSCAQTKMNVEKVVGYGGIHLAAVSQVAANLVPEDQHVDVIYNGVDTARLKQTRGRKRIRRKLGIKKNDMVVGLLGRVAAVKHPHSIAHAVIGLRNRGIQAKSLFVGDHKDQKYVDKVLDIDPKAIFVDHTENVGDMLAAMDVMMLPSCSEGFSLAQIEAWMARVPVVATLVGAVEELENQHGSLVVRIPVNGEPDELADAVLLAVSKANEAVVEYAHNLAMKEFTVEAMVERWEKYLEGILNNEKTWLCH